MKDVKARIEQNLADQARLKEEGERLQHEKEESEVTYSVGDRFRRSSSRDKYLLIRQGIDGYEVCLVGLENGHRNGQKKYSVSDYKYITPSEIGRVYDGSAFVRYWDSRKKVKT